MTSATESEVMIQLNERQIYDLEWLEDCYKKVRFPNPKCEDFLTEINKTLSNKIRGTVQFVSSMFICHNLSRLLIIKFYMVTCELLN